MKVAINGFGRIGRNVLRAALRNKVDVVAINDVHGIKDAEYLFKYDSVYGKYDGKVFVERDNLVIDGKKIKVLNERKPEKLPWKKMKVDVVVESTGVFRYRKDALKHVSAGAKKVIVTAPMKDDADMTVVPGVNEKEIKTSDKLFSVASCTTNAAAPTVKVLHDYFGVKRVLLSTVHGYTSSQALVDGSNEKDLRRGRAAAVNIIPTSTGASDAVVKAIPELKGKVGGMALRVPVPDGSIVDVTAQLEKPFDAKMVNDAFKKAASKELKGILEYSEEELVSTDIIENPHSAIFDSKFTMQQGDMIKVLSWYDNEYGYSCRVVDLVKLLGKK